MNVLLLSVPQWYPASPYLAGALLVGQLRRHGFSADYRDLNIEFYNDILTQKYLSSCLDRAREISEQPLPSACDLPPAFADKLLQTYENRKYLIDLFLRGSTNLQDITERTERAVSVLKTKDFYDPEKFYQAKDILQGALEIASLPYLPASIRMDNYISSPFFTYDFADVDFQCGENSVNMFLDYFEQKLKKTDLSKYDLIGISVTDLSQIIPAMTLARMLKKMFHAKICLGGNYIFKIAADLRRFPKVFDEYCDFLLVGDGETAVLELAEYLAGKRELQNVHSLTYKAPDGSVCCSEMSPALHLDAVAFPDFDDYDFSLYFTPELILPVQLGKGCYWGKCTFCDFYTGQQSFDMKSVCRAVDEVEFLSRKYNCTHFNFVDEAVPPAFYFAFAQEILRRKITVRYYSFARLERAFTPQVLQTLYDSGARFFMWGYEAESARVMRLMNKGIDVFARKTILRNAVAAGLWNLCTFLLCYPTETQEELASTIDVIYDQSIVDTCTPSNFALKRNAILKDHTEDAAITTFVENGDLHISYKYQSSVTSMEEIKNKRNAFERQYLRDTADRLFPHTFTECDYLLLYLSKYGRAYVKNYRLQYRKKL